jgi:hypothetical protein
MRHEVQEGIGHKWRGSTKDDTEVVSVVMMQGGAHEKHAVQPKSFRKASEGGTSDEEERRGNSFSRGLGSAINWGAVK